MILFHLIVIIKNKDNIYTTRVNKTTPFKETFKALYQQQIILMYIKLIINAIASDRGDNNESKLLEMISQ